MINDLKKRFEVRRSRGLRFMLQPSSLILSLAVLAALVNVSSSAQRPQRNGAHPSAPREVFSAADQAMVLRATQVTCSERVRDPLSSMPIDEMQSRPSLAIDNPAAVAGLRRAERLLPLARKFVAAAIIKLARDYNLYQDAAYRSRIVAATARVQAVRRIKPDVDARDNASVVLREPHTIQFGTIFLAGLRSDEGMISVLSHELTHIADGQSDSLRPLFQVVARRAAPRTGLSITGQRQEELVCDLVGVMAAREFIQSNASWEPVVRRLSRAIEHNCVTDDASDDDHLSPRSTIRALFSLDLDFAAEIAAGNDIGSNTTVSPARFKMRPPPSNFAMHD